MTWKPQSAMVLAAGFGTRMRPLTDRIPKPLVPLAGKPLIDHVLDRVADAGIQRAVVNVHHFAEKLEAHLATRHTPEIVISDERDVILETGGGVVKALPLLGPEPFLIHNSDAVWIEEPHGASNIARLISAWDESRKDALLLIARVEHMLGYDGDGDFTLGPDGRLVRRSKGEKTPYVFTGVSIAHPRLLAGCEAERHSLNVPWDRALSMGRLHGLAAHGQWMHVGTPEAIAEAEHCIRASA